MGSWPIGKVLEDFFKVVAMKLRTELTNEETERTREGEGTARSSLIVKENIICKRPRVDRKSEAQLGLKGLARINNKRLYSNILTFFFGGGGAMGSH